MDRPDRRRVRRVSARPFPERGQIGLWRVDETGRTLWSNAIFKDWHGGTAPESVATMLRDLERETASELADLLSAPGGVRKLRVSGLIKGGADVTVDASDRAAGTLVVIQPIDAGPIRADEDALFGAPVEDLPTSVVNRMSQILNKVVAFVGICNLDGVLLEANEPALAAAGLSRADVIGKPFWDCYWWAFDPEVQERLRDAVARAAQGETVRYDTPIRVGEGARITIDFQIAPLRDHTGRIIELIPSGVDITERAASEASRELLLHELSHRVKNTLAMVQSIAGHSARGAGSTDDFMMTFRGRLRAVSACHDLLVETEHRSAAMDDLIARQVRPYSGEGERVSLSGPDIDVPGELAHALSMVLHELATNASKYGALSTGQGRVEVAWDHSDEHLHLTWTERGGPAVRAPERRGFGSRLISQSLEHTFDARVDVTFEPEGLQARFAIPHSA